MILLCGIRSESPLAMVADALAKLDLAHRIFHQRDVASCRIEWRVAGGAVAGTLLLCGEEIDLATIEGVYMRLMDDRLLPELEGLPDEDPARRHSRAFHEALMRWSEVAPARVVNRAEPQGSNGSKPYQAQLIAAQGFAPPPTLITNDPEAVLAFRKEHGRIIYKSMSGVRSVVGALEEEDLDKLERIRWCPVQFQKALEGINVRVHVIGAAAFATEIESTHIDYRYAKRDGGETSLRAITLPRPVRARCVALAKALGLDFAGIDLMRTPADEYYCFEVNPQPAFSYFEANSGQPIARAVARHLAGLKHTR
jgi:glutathione synthase/RimK-type ligase-like ATP-grasp enzyme